MVIPESLSVLVVYVGVFYVFLGFYEVYVSGSVGSVEVGVQPPATVPEGSEVNSCSSSEGYFIQLKEIDSFDLLGKNVNSRFCLFQAPRRKEGITRLPLLETNIS